MQNTLRDGECQISDDNPVNVVWNGGHGKQISWLGLNHDMNEVPCVTPKERMGNLLKVHEDNPLFLPGIPDMRELTFFRNNDAYISGDPCLTRQSLVI